MKFVVKNDLSRFLKKLNNYNDNNLASKVAEHIEQEAKSIATNMYAGTTVNIRTTPIKKGKFSLIANRKGIAFLEFGTGVVGRDSNYQGKLPQTGIPITGRWEYWYPSEYKAVFKGKQGWWTNIDEFGQGKGRFLTGQPAKSQMFYTTQTLREYIKSKLKGDIKK